jgi:hypothetical protein
MASKDASKDDSIWDESYDIIKTKKTITVPVTKNISESYTVNVPKRKAVNVTKQVPYTTYEKRIKHVPYQYFDRQTVTRNVQTCRAIPTIQSVCTTVPVKRRSLSGIFKGNQSYVRKKCPRIVYVAQSCCEPRQFCQSIPRTGWRTAEEHVPVQKFETQTEVKYTTEQVPEERQRTRSVTTMVKKTVPVYNIVPKPPPSPEMDRLLHTVLAPEEKQIVEVPRMAQGNAIQTSAIPYPIVDNDQVTRISQNGNYMSRYDGAYLQQEQGPYIGSDFPAQYENRYHNFGQRIPMPVPMATQVIPTNTKWGERLGAPQIRFNTSVDTHMVPMNANYGISNGLQRYEEYDTGNQAQPQVAYTHQTSVGQGVATDYRGGYRGVNLGQRRL